MVPVGVALLVLAAVLATWATVEMTHGNPGTRLPWLFGRSPRISRRVRALRGLAGGTAVLGAIQLQDSWGYWGVLAIAGVGVVACPLQLKHNRGIESTESGGTAR